MELARDARRSACSCSPLRATPLFHSMADNPCSSVVELDPGACIAYVARFPSWSPSVKAQPSISHDIGCFLPFRLDLNHRPHLLPMPFGFPQVQPWSSSLVPRYVFLSFALAVGAAAMAFCARSWSSPLPLICGAIASSQAAVVLSVPARVHGQVNQVRQRSIIKSTIVAAACLAARSPGCRLLCPAPALVTCVNSGRHRLRPA
jgi:hypothetical protein